MQMTNNVQLCRFESAMHVKKVICVCGKLALQGSNKLQEHGFINWSQNILLLPGLWQIPTRYKKRKL